jgi:iron complex transport system substrate-binding protein
MNRNLALLAAATLALVAAGATAAPKAAAPRRVVSLNPCLDAILMEVADPGQITALSRYSRQPTQSAVWAEARRYPFTRGSGEEIVALQPDLVISSGMGAAELTHVLPRLHIRQESFTVPNSVKASMAQVTRVAGLVGHPERGAALNARVLAAVSDAAPKPGEPRIGALIYEYHGVASGPKTLMDELMRDAGFNNLAPRYGLKRTVDVPLERLLADPPGVLLAGSLAPGEPTWADRVLSHPALKALAPRMRRESFPETLMFCGGPVMIPTLAALKRARIDAARGISR